MRSPIDFFDARHCVLDAPEGKKDDRTEDMMAAVGRPMRRG
jgi:hypothetical protein